MIIKLNNCHDYKLVLIIVLMESLMTFHDDDWNDNDANDDTTNNDTS